MIPGGDGIILNVISTGILILLAANCESSKLPVVVWHTELHSLFGVWHDRFTLLLYLSDEICSIVKQFYALISGLLCSHIWSLISSGDKPQDYCNSICEWYMYIYTWIGNKMLYLDTIQVF